MFKKIFISTIFFFFLTGTVFTQPSKIVLIEEGTGTWCAWCPEGKVYSNDLLHEYPEEIIFIEVHGIDPMEDKEYKESSSFFLYPSAHINRKIKHLETWEWEGNLGTEFNEIPPANVNVQMDYDLLNRNLTVHVSADFFENLSIDYRLAAIIVEDAVTGDNQSYNQSNIFANNTNGPMGGYETLPQSIPYDLMPYDHIGRHLLGGYNGAPGSLPTQVEAGNTYTHSFDWTLPTEYDEEYIWVAALLINNENGHVINVGKSIYLLGNENAKPLFVSKPLTVAHKDFPYVYNIRYHDPNDDSYKIDILEPIPSWLNFQRDRTGFAVLKGVPENLGTYDVTLRVTDAEYSVDQSFQIIVKDSIPPPPAVISRLTHDFLILPNPNNGVFILEFDKGIKYQIFDGLGRVVTNGTLVRNLNDKRFSMPINIEGLNTGIYFLKVFDNNGYVKTCLLYTSPSPRDRG